MSTTGSPLVVGRVVSLDRGLQIIERYPHPQPSATQQVIDAAQDVVHGREGGMERLREAVERYERLEGR